jgi:subtilisin family serine protease
MPQTTGKYLVLLPEDNVNAGIRSLSDTTGIRSVARAADFPDNAMSGQELESEDTLVFEDLGVAVVSLDPEQLQSVNMAVANDSEPVLAIEPERVVYALSDVGSQRVGQPISSLTNNLSLEYLKGYRDGIDNLVNNLLTTEQQVQNVVAALIEDQTTWGLQATKVLDSPFTGKGIKVAVLDTGLDLTHPDLVGRKIVSRSFVDDEEVQDGNGHGTHCIGTACGALNPGKLPRYGVAYDAEIYAGKVLSNKGRGGDRGILAGITWAIVNGCEIISMSLGSPTFPGQPYSRIFDFVGRRALKRGTLIIAAAGNESDRRNGSFNPVGHPANCPSIMAVAALDSQLQIGNFSNRGINPSGGQIDIAAPGVNVYSTWPLPTTYKSISGTSMATPHVAGIAALYAEANPEARGEILWNLLIQNAQRLILPSVDIGVGLVQAPV